MKSERARQALIVVIAVALLGIVASIVTILPSSQDDPSSTANGKSGTLALYNWLGALGLQTSRVEGAFVMGSADSLFIIEPAVGLSSRDVGTVHRFLDSGGTVIVADNTSNAEPLLKDVGMNMSFADISGTATNTIPLDAAGRVHAVPMSNAVEVSGPNAVALLTLRGSIVAATQNLGRGRIYVVTSELPFSNDGLRHGDSALFVLALLERARGGRIAFDEVHHGSTGASGPETGGLGEIFNGPLGLAVLLGALVLVLGLGVNGRHLGAPVPRRDPARVPSAVDRVQSLAELFARSGDRGAIALRYAEELKRHVATLTGVDFRLSDKDFVAALWGGPEDRVRATAVMLERAQSLAASQPSTQALISLARDVVTLEALWSQPVAVVAR